MHIICTQHKQEEGKKNLTRCILLTLLLNLEHTLLTISSKLRKESIFKPRYLKSFLFSINCPSSFRPRVGLSTNWPIRCLEPIIIEHDLVGFTVM